MIALATCVSSKITIPFTDGKEFSKDQFGILIVFFDMATVLVLIIFINTIQFT